MNSGGKGSGIVGSAKKWEERKKSWPIQFVTAGVTGALGSIAAAFSEMESLELSSLKFGTIVVILAWIIGTGVSTLAIWLFCRYKYKQKLTERAEN